MARAQAKTVAPVVSTSSTSKTRSPATAGASDAEGVRDGLAPRPRVHAGAVSLGAPLAHEVPLVVLEPVARGKRSGESRGLVEAALTQALVVERDGDGERRAVEQRSAL
jgi:hypothetical protein